MALMCFPSSLAGSYTLNVTAHGLALAQPQTGNGRGGARNTCKTLPSALPVDQQQVTVTEQDAGLDTSPDNNAGAIVIKGKDLDALSDDPDQLQDELNALAGPAAGPNGGEIYIDGFSGGQLPPKSSIREIRINQNPFSAEYDKLGYGRIEILTKPGTDKLHGSVMINGNDSAFNSLNTFVTSEPAVLLHVLSGQCQWFPEQPIVMVLQRIPPRQQCQLHHQCATARSNRRHLQLLCAVPNPQIATGPQPAP